MMIGLKKVPTYEWNMKKVAKSRGGQDSKSRCLVFSDNVSDGLGRLHSLLHCASMIHWVNPHESSKI